MQLPSTGPGFFAPEAAGPPETHGETMQAVCGVVIEDNGELLVDPRELDPRITFAGVHPWSGAQRTPWVRRTVARMLTDAAALLPDGLRLQIVEGYRPLEVQRQLFVAACDHLRVRHPEWSEEHLREAATAWVAAPDSDAPPPHVTGGAVDVTLVDAAGGAVDMTGPAGWTEATAPTACPDIPDQARRNRAALCGALTAAGLTNYPGEWWHWSYGEPGWAVRTGHPIAVYGAVEAQMQYEI